MEMKNYFKIGEGVKIDTTTKYTQQRVDYSAVEKAPNEKYITFYPTYVTTGRMFKLLGNNMKRDKLIYGRWGIGKTLSVILYK
jgi:hypothetical protein